MCARLRPLALGVVALLAATAASAQVPISLFRSYAGNIQFTGTAGSLRAQSNAGNACALNATSSAALGGIPAGSTIRAAFLYWAGSGAAIDAAVTLATPAGTSGVNADRTFQETFVSGASTYRFFSGMADVTSLVSAGGNGTYTFSNLTVSAGNPWCGVQLVVAGWSLVVVYEHVSQPLRVLNISDGFQNFRGNALTIVDTNFEAPPSSIDAFVSHITWDGDTENSAALGGFTEDLRFNGTSLTDAINPVANQFNSASNIVPTTTSWGVDFDRYDVSALVAAGATSATTRYSSGGDRVLLSAEIFSVTNVPIADVAIAKTHSGNFTTGQNGDYTLAVSNLGPSVATGTVTVTDTLPAGLSFVSASGTGWTCGAAAQVVTCTHPGPIPNASALPDITLTVNVAANAPTSLTNTASVANATFDNVAGNNSASDATTIVALPDPLVIKSSLVLNDPVNAGSNPKAIPGANVQYTIGVSNQGSGSPDADSVLVEDPIPAELDLYVNGFGGPSPILFVDGATPSALSLVFSGLASPTDDIDFDDGTSAFTYTPVPDANGYDAAVRAIRVRPSGTFAGASLTATPSFELRFQARVK